MDHIALAEDTIQMAREAKENQGIHETEVSFNGECDLKKAFIDCDKNPGHVNFIPIKDITTAHLPDRWGEITLEFLRLKAEEAVKLSCSLTSQDRPDGYIFSSYKGKQMLRVGSGRVWSVHLDKTNNDIPCPFPECVDATGPHFVHGPFRIHTAMHVVFDDVEAKSTVVAFFYDSEDDVSNVIKARGVSVELGDISADYCVMTCVSHDPTLSQKLDQVRRSSAALYWGQVEPIVSLQDVAVVISHPHGRSKHVTIGPCMSREFGFGTTQGQGWFKYKFKTDTCPGCSGAPVLVPGNANVRGGYAPHSGYLGNGINTSAVWFWW